MSLRGGVTISVTGDETDLRRATVEVERSLTRLESANLLAGDSYEVMARRGYVATAMWERQQRALGAPGPREARGRAGLRRARRAVPLGAAAALHGERRPGQGGRLPRPVPDAAEPSGDDQEGGPDQRQALPLCLGRRPHELQGS